MRLKKRTKSKYRLRVGKDGPVGRFEEVRQVHHVAHLRSAQSILRKGRIPGLPVDDDSRLDAHDVEVCWLAPNPWAESHFGTVRFTFDFADIIRDRSIYWVEGVKNRGPDTCRLLITGTDVAGLPVKAYDPESTEGPLRRFRGRWFRKAGVQLELMIGGDLPLADCRQVGTALHNRGRCKGTCREVGRSASDTAARLLAGLMRGRYGLPAASYVDSGRASALIHDGWFGLLEALDLLDGEVSGGIKGKARVDKIVRRALRDIAADDPAKGADRVSRIADERRVRRSLRRFLQRATGLELGQPYDTVIGLAPQVVATTAAPLSDRRGRAAAQPRPARRGDPGEAVRVRA